MIAWFAVLLTEALAGTTGRRDPSSSAPAQADDTDAAEGESMTGRTPPPLAREPRPAEAIGYQMPEALTVAAAAELEYPHETYVGAQMLGLDPMFVYAVQQGLDLLYERKYTGAREHFAAVEQTFPGTGVRALGDTLVWQALMLENFDFRYDDQYWTASKQAHKDLEGALGVKGAESWEHLALAAVVGIESIHTMRQAKYLPALQMAFQAMAHIEECRKAAPEFVDLQLADGMYNYWRSVVTLNSKILPDFGDHRTEGIEQMSVVQRSGIFVRPLAALSLSFTWMEEKDWHRAVQTCVANRGPFPDNVINNLTCGQIYTHAKDFPKALESFDRVAAVDPKNARVHYLRGWALLRQGQPEAAKAELTTYLASDHLEPWQRSYANLRLGQAHAKLGAYPEAVASYEAAVKVDGNKDAKAALAKLDEQRKSGKITY